MPPSDSDLDPAIVSEQRAWRSAESLDYYRHHRQRLDDLYPSERFFLPDIVRQSGSMLDVGCAAGGFSAVAKALNPQLRYCGIDVVPAFVDTARREHPESEFRVGDGVSFDTPPGSYDLVHASGVLHLNRRFRDIIAAMWVQTNRYLLCDLRLTTQEAEVGEMIAPFGEEDGASLPYIVLQVADAVALFQHLVPPPASIRVRGYPHRAAGAARLRNPDIAMAFFLAEKGPASACPTLDVDLNG
jgi:SAM-dependent methyltransferase